MYQRWIAAAMIAASTGCEAPLEPAATGGEVVPGSRGARCDGDAPLSLSPDGRWLGFASADPHANAVDQPRIVLIDLATDTVFEPAPGPEALGRIRDRRGPSMRTLCWSPDGERAHLSGPSIPVAAGSKRDPESEKQDAPASRLERAARSHRERELNRFVIKLDAPGTLETATGQPDCVERHGQAWRFGSPLSDNPGITRGLRLDTSGEERVRLIMPDGSVLTEHKTRNPLSDRIGVTTYAWSADGQRLAYVISEGFGMGGSPSRGYLLDLAASPTSAQRKELATSIHALHWHGKDDLYACLEIGGGSITAIAHWAMTP